MAQYSVQSGNVFCAVTAGMSLCDGRQGQALPWAPAPYVMGPAAALQVQRADVSPIDQAGIWAGSGEGC